MTEPRDPPLRKGERTRQKILAAAAAVFSAHGAGNVKVEAIAVEAGVSPATLYKYFPTKQGLVLEFVSEGLGLLESYLEEVRERPSPLERVYLSGDAYLRFARERPGVCRFMSVRALQPDVAPELEAANALISTRIQQLILTVARDLREAMRTDELVEAPVDELMVVLWSMFSGMTTFLVRQDGTALPPELIDRSIAFARDMMRRAEVHAREHPESPARPPGASS